MKTGIRRAGSRRERGLGAEAAERLAELGAKEIVYLSCDPSTLARDLVGIDKFFFQPRKPKEITRASIRYEITGNACV